MVKRLPRPLEVVDGALDTVAEVAKLPSRVGGKVMTSGAKTGQDFEGAITSMQQAGGDIPAPPTAVVDGGLRMIGAAVGGVLGAVGGVLDGVKETTDGVRRQVDRITR